MIVPWRSWSGVRDELDSAWLRISLRGRSAGALLPNSDTKRPGTLVGSSAEDGASCATSFTASAWVFRRPAAMTPEVVVSQARLDRPGRCLDVMRSFLWAGGSDGLNLSPGRAIG